MRHEGFWMDSLWGNQTLSTPENEHAALRRKKSWRWSFSSENMRTKMSSSFLFLDSYFHNAHLYRLHWELIWVQIRSINIKILTTKVNPPHIGATHQTSSSSTLSSLLISLFQQICNIMNAAEDEFFNFQVRWLQPYSKFIGLITLWGWF